MQMRAVVLHEPRVWRVEEVERPDAGPNDVVVKVGASGLCGTDLKIFEGEYLSPYPLIPGHETAGTVVSVGVNVPSDYLNRRVGVDPTLSCGHCEFCQATEFNHCESWGAVGDTRDGGFAEYVSVPVANVHALPEAFSFNLGALAEPVACAVWALERIKPKLGGSALIFGAGPMGLILSRLIQQAGFFDCVVVDQSAPRLEQVRTVGVLNVVHTDQLGELQDAHPRGFDLVVDATGSPTVFSQAIPWVRKNGQLLLFGVAPRGALTPIEPYLIYHNEITIVSSMAINHSYGGALKVLRHRSQDFASLVTHRLGLDDYGKAIDLVLRGQGIKVQLEPEQ